MNAFEQAVRTVRFLAVDAVEKAQSGHPGAPMALAGIAVEIFSRHLRYNPKDPEWPNRDRFILSCGHASMLLYATLHLAGYDLSIDDLKSFRKLGSKTPGHPEYGCTPGVETTTGPLGQGVANAVGLALASKLMAERVNRPGDELIDYRVFVLASDGDLMEGVASEAASIAGHLQLDNLVVVYADNQITIDGGTNISFSEDVQKRFEAYGWAVQRVDGHNAEEVSAALTEATKQKQPSLIIARTHIGYGSPHKQDTPACHGAALGKDEVRATKECAGWPLEPTFLVPEEAYVPFKEQQARNAGLYEAWLQRTRALSGERAELFQALRTRQTPKDLLERLLSKLELKADATRSHAGRVQQIVAELIPSLVGGSADLAGSAKTTLTRYGDVAAGDFSGRNLHYGVREHAMAAISNGLSLSGFFIPFTSTFLIFSDYMRPAVRLSSLMDQQVIYVFSHDSVFLGEDGPTHQPIEQLWTLRLIPHLDVVRPADARECAAAWAYAAARRNAPTVISLTRHKVPELARPEGFEPAQMLDGAYVVSDTPDPELTLIASGSEVHVAVEAREILQAQGKRVRVVSAPCWQAFSRLDKAKQERVLGRGTRLVSIEAGSTWPWRGVVGPDGITIGIDRFGASGPLEELAKFFGLTAKQVASKILEQL